MSFKIKSEFKLKRDSSACTFLAVLVKDIILIQEKNPLFYSWISSFNYVSYYSPTVACCNKAELKAFDVTKNVTVADV